MDVKHHVYFTFWNQSSGAVWESRWTSWAVRPNEPSGFRGRKDLLNRDLALVTTCPWYVNWHLRTLSITSSSSSLAFIVQELCESRGGRPGLSVLTSLLVSVDVKIYWTVLRHWSQLVPNMSNDIWGHQLMGSINSSSSSSTFWKKEEEKKKKKDTPRRPVWKRSCC